MEKRKRRRGLLRCLLLAVLMIPALAMNTAAESTMSSSEDAISLIKKFEGFHPKAYWDVSQWTIGYGTNGSAGQVITEAQADAAMREHLAVIDQKINQFADRIGRSFSQQQHDALASLSFNCGTGWMNDSGRLRDAVVNGATGNDFLFAMSLWANISSVPDRGLLNRRLSEANLYINGVYSKNSPGEFSYVILNPNGGTAGHNGEDKMQGYIVASNVSILAQDPVKSGTSFTGWFTAPSGGRRVQTLDGAVAGQTLYAQYSDGSVADGLWSGGSGGSVIDRGTVRCDTYVNIRSGAGTGNNILGKAYNGNQLDIYEITESGGLRWARTEKGWICLQYVVLDSSGYSQGSQGNQGGQESGKSGVVINATKVNVRKAAGVGNAVVTTLREGTAVTVYQQVTKDGAPWGRIDQGWICMDYIRLNGSLWEGDNNSSGSNSAAPTDTVLFTGKVSSTTALRVRSGAGVNNAVVGTLNPGDAVSVYETRTTGGTEWGRIGSGRWVSLTYVRRDGAADQTQTPSTGNKGTVISSTVLNVRAGAGVGNAIVSSLAPGASVTILEEKTVSGLKWGRIGEKQWVCLNYIRLDGGSTNSNSGSSSGGIWT